MLHDKLPVSYGNFTPDFLDELAVVLRGKRVLEVFAGNGLLASLLATRGIEITSTSRLSGHDGHESGFHHPVIEMEADQAVTSLGAERDVLLMSWPTADEGATRAALAWGEDRPIIFIGEITRFGEGMMGLGGCASDLFFAITEIEHDITSYEPRNRLERAVVMRLNRDAVRKTLKKGVGEV